MSQNPATYGLALPTQTAMLSGNPRDSAITSQQLTNNKLTSLNKAVGGKSRHNKKHKKSCRCKLCKILKKYISKSGGGTTSSTGTLTVPQFTMQYTPTNGPGQTPNDVIKQNSQITTQGTANAAYDKYATQKGGYVYGKKYATQKGGYIYSKKILSSISKSSNKHSKSSIKSSKSSNKHSKSSNKHSNVKQLKIKSKKHSTDKTMKKKKN